MMNLWKSEERGKWVPLQLHGCRAWGADYEERLRKALTSSSNSKLCHLTSSPRIFLGCLLDIDESNGRLFSCRHLCIYKYSNEGKLNVLLQMLLNLYRSHKHIILRRGKESVYFLPPLSSASAHIACFMSMQPGNNRRSRHGKFTTHVMCINLGHLETYKSRSLVSTFRSSTPFHVISFIWASS